MTNMEAKLGLSLALRALRRLWARDAMLYVGGVSFFALLAMAPSLTLFVSLYSLIATPTRAAQHVIDFAKFLPSEAQTLVAGEARRIVRGSARIIGLQNSFALLVAAYAAHRGAKALLAGLQLIYADQRKTTLVAFNVQGLVVAVGAFVFVTLASFAFVAVRIGPVQHHHILALLLPLKGWVMASSTLTLGFALLYRYGMTGHPISWRASITSGAIASALTLVASAFLAVYVNHVVNIGETYGSFGAVLVFLIWLSWNAHVVLYGGALCAEIEGAMGRRPSGAL
jgi:membrane protein